MGTRINGLVTHSSDCGPRQYQEDRLFYERFFLKNFKGWFMAVFDGHGGSQTSHFCSRRIGNIFYQLINKHSDIEKVLNLLISNLVKNTSENFSGSTLSIACVSEEKDEVVIAILGDSPVIVVDSDKEVHLSPEHNVITNIKERNIAIERGARYEEPFIFKGNETFGLQLSRALGDFLLEGILSREPEIYTIKKPRWVVVCSDGLLDPSHQNAISFVDELIKFSGSGAEADNIMSWAKNRGLMDNATALLWKPLVS